MFSASSSPRFLCVLIGLSLAVGAFGVALFTELGQLLNLPSNWLYAVHPNLGCISALLVVVLFILYHHFRNRLLSRRLVVAYAVVVLGMVFVTILSPTSGYAGTTIPPSSSRCPKRMPYSKTTPVSSCWRSACMAMPVRAGWNDCPSIRTSRG